MKLAIDVMQSQYSLFNEKQLDSSANSCVSDWILLALSPMGMYLNTLILCAIHLYFLIFSLW